MKTQPMGRTLSALLLVSLMWAATVSPAVAGGVVTDCSNDVQFSSRLTGGGTITFNCGTAVIPLSTALSISADTTIDGGGKITLSGQNAHRLFVVGNGAKLTLRNIVLTSGSSTGDGGAIFNNGSLTLDRATIRNSVSALSGGAIVSYGPLTVLDSVLEDNEALNGGAIYPRFPPAQTTISGSVLRFNKATDGTNGWGGAMLLWDGAPVSIEKSDIYGNTARLGGAIYVFPNSFVVLNSSTLRNNVAKDGGALYNYQKVTLVNVTLSTNGASATGGGLFNESGSSATLTNVTLSGNTANSGAGIANFGFAQLANTIIANSPAIANCSGNTLTSLGYNIDSGASCGLIQTGDRSQLDPKLGPLQNNGGPTWTHMPLSTSPAIDRGNPATPGSGGAACPAVDQRGTVRPQRSRCDIGAVEVRPVGPVYLPLITKPVPVVPLVDCNDHEDNGGNDDQTTARQLTTVGQACQGSLEDDPIGEAGDDYYWLDLAAGTPIAIDLTAIPVGANYSLGLFRFDPPALVTVGFSDLAGNTAEQVKYTSPHAARYFIRLRKNASAPTPDTYVLSVRLQ
jgi:hypothetical protein